ncbi:hypothetical protein ACLOJK_009985 [Asimina triloba]
MYPFSLRISANEEEKNQRMEEQMEENRNMRRLDCGPDGREKGREDFYKSWNFLCPGLYWFAAGTGSGFPLFDFFVPNPFSYFCRASLASCGGALLFEHHKKGLGPPRISGTEYSVPNERPVTGNCDILTYVSGFSSTLPRGPRVETFFVVNARIESKKRPFRISAVHEVGLVTKQRYYAHDDRVGMTAGICAQGGLGFIPDEIVIFGRCGRFSGFLGEATPSAACNSVGLSPSGGHLRSGCFARSHERDWTTGDGSAEGILFATSSAGVEKGRKDDVDWDREVQKREGKMAPTRVKKGRAGTTVAGRWKMDAPVSIMATTRPLEDDQKCRGESTPTATIIDIGERVEKRREEVNDEDERERVEKGMIEVNDAGRLVGRVGI